MGSIMRLKWIEIILLIMLLLTGFASANEPGWNKNFGGSNWERANSVQQTIDGGYIIAGGTKSFQVEGSDSSAWLIRTDSQGNKMWDKTFGGSRVGWATCVRQTIDGGYIISGSTQ
jgi:hypothetical protein